MKRIFGSALVVVCAAALGAWSAPASASTTAAGRVPASATAVWADAPSGFAALPGYGIATTTGGAGGRVVEATTLDELRTYAAAAEPLVIQIRKSITVTPFGDMVKVASDKSILGVGTGGELVGGGLYLNATHNVIIRNLTIRDSYLAADWDGKDSTNDNDGIRLDTVNHVWIDHNLIERVGDGGIDTRKDSDNITYSWNIIGDINKALGLGWTTNVITKMTAHHNWIRNTVQRNYSIDNAAAAHLYNNYEQDIAIYGTMSRNAAKVVVEKSVYDNARDPIVAKDPASEIVPRDNIYKGTTSGRIDSVGTAFDPSSYYSYTPDPVKNVEALVRAYAGPERRPAHAGRTITVALDGTGQYEDLQAALGAVRDTDGPATIRVSPGVYREVVVVWPEQSGVTIEGTTDNPADVVITYGLAVNEAQFYGGIQGTIDSPTVTLLGSNVTMRNLTVQNDYDQTLGAGPAIAVRTVGDHELFEHTRFVGDNGTYLADVPAPGTASHTLLRDCFVGGTVNVVSGPGAATLQNCTIGGTGATS